MEVKKARDGLPNDMWETYSAFANCYGGVIILGVVEREDGSWKTTGLKDERNLRKVFWDTIHNPNKVNINLLSEDDIETYTLGDNDDVILVIRVPMAKREQKPVYINNKMFGGTFRRIESGDYCCTIPQVKAMLRDQTENTIDMRILDDVPMEELNYDTIHGYRNRHKALKPGHPFEHLDDYEYLRRIGAAAISVKDKQLHPTAAGLLMFGDDYNIDRQFPGYFLDYREELDPEIRWTDRLQSSSGDWSGNVCDFYFRVYNKIIKDIKVPFKMQGGVRIDDTPVHKALREALANCLINADYLAEQGVVIKKERDQYIFDNPSNIRTGKEQMRLGGESDPRNKALMKMFNLINIGERAGSGVPGIFDVWKENGWVEPIIEERFNPARTILTLKTISVIQYHIDVFLEKVAQEGNLSKEDLVKLSAIMKHAEYFARFSSSEFEEREQEKTYDLLLDDQMHNGVIIEVMSNKLLHYYENNERLYKNALILMEKVAESAREVAEPAEKVAEPAEKVAEPAEKVAESAQKVADLSKMEDEAMSKRHKEILLLMEMGVEYSADEIAVSIGLKGSRTRKLLKELISMKKIKVTAATKNRRYIKM